ncbi:hypothetical protein ACTHGU_15205 [Chitinophagaceae bacterium MMS25-I14]
MAAPRSYIVLQAYGQESILQECLFALLTFSKHHSITDTEGLEIWIYTDQEAWFRKFADCPLPLKFRTIDSNDLKQWRGAIDFVHRVKIEVLRDITKRVTGSVLYLDTDVCFLEPVSHMLQKVAAGDLYMHIRESVIRDNGNPVFAKFHRFLKKNNPLQIDGKPLHVSTDSVMWNAGVLGFHTKYADLLDDVLTFTDNVYTQFHKHVVEQFAFSYYFQNTGFIHSAAREIFHYWHFKEMRLYLASFFEYFKNAGWDELVQHTELIQWHAPVQDKCSFYQNRNCINKLRRVRWQPVMPDWAQLLKQMD